MFFKRLFGTQVYKDLGTICDDENHPGLRNRIMYPPDGSGVLSVPEENVFDDVEEAISFLSPKAHRIAQLDLEALNQARRIWIPLKNMSEAEIKTIQKMFNERMEELTPKAKAKPGRAAQAEKKGAPKA